MIRSRTTRTRLRTRTGWRSALALFATLLATPAARAADDDFLRALPGRPLVLPADHASHPATRTEWWYLTGPLRTDDGRVYGLQATWFRRALLAELPDDRSPLAARDVILFHAGLVGIEGDDERRFTEQAMRAAGGWARADTERLDVALLDHELVDPTGEGREARMAFGAGDAWIELDVDLDAVEPLLHGAEPGLSIKGHEAGQASWYYSLPRLPVVGTLRRPGEEPVAARGELWFDHEFGSSQLGPEQIGWDWFSVALDDGGVLMLYQMRTTGGRPDTTSAGTWRGPDGERRHLGSDAFHIDPMRRWRSPDTGIEYPAEWRLNVPSADLSLRVTPARPDAEFSADDVTGVTYWEGLCVFEGTRGERAVRGEGYVELVGYGDSIAARFAPGR